MIEQQQRLYMVVALTILFSGCCNKDTRDLHIYKRLDPLVIDKRDCRKSLSDAIIKSRKQTVIIKAYEKQVLEQKK